MKRLGILAALVLASPAYAGKPDSKLLIKTCQDLMVSMSNPDARPGLTSPAFVFAPNETTIGEKDYHAAVGTINGYGGDFTSVKVAVAEDGSAAWVQGEFDEATPCTKDPCGHPPPYRHLHYTMLFDQGTWMPQAGVIAVAVPDADVAKALKKGTKLEPLKADTKGTAEPAKLFEDTIGDPAKLAASVSERADAVMFGSAPKEMYTGGKAVKAQLAAWKLPFAIDGGVRSGALQGDTVVWVAAIVKAKDVPYRAFAIYEKSKDGWRIVSLSFSFVAGPLT